MNEAIVQIVEGKVGPGKCKFCDESAIHVFGVIDTKDIRYVANPPHHQGYPMKAFSICEKHLRALNSLLDGSKDIDSLIKTYDRLMAGGRFNLRAHI